jgi:hypothetical protein
MGAFPRSRANEAMTPHFVAYVCSCRILASAAADHGEGKRRIRATANKLVRLRALLLP